MDDILFPSFKPRLRASTGVRTGVSNLASHGRGRRSDKQTRLTERVRVELRATRSALPWETEAVLASGQGRGQGRRQGLGTLLNLACVCEEELASTTGSSP